MKSAVAGQNHEFLLTVTHELSGLLDSATKIASGTSDIANSPSATFELSSTPVRSTFECGIDGGVFSLMYLAQRTTPTWGMASILSAYRLSVRGRWTPRRSRSRHHDRRCRYLLPQPSSLARGLHRPRVVWRDASGSVVRPRRRPGMVHRMDAEDPKDCGAASRHLRWWVCGNRCSPQESTRLVVRQDVRERGPVKKRLPDHGYVSGTPRPPHRPDQNRLSVTVCGFYTVCTHTNLVHPSFVRAIMG
jgi:hypothetical protein